MDQTASARHSLSPQQTLEGVRSPADGGRSRRILAVDDNVDAAQMLADLLRLKGHEVRVAYDGPSALEAVAAFGPEVVLLDIGLPGMNGFEVAEQLRQNMQIQGMLLIAVTGYNRAMDRQRCRQAGFQHHLVKPLDLRVLDGLLAQSLNQEGGRHTATNSC